MIVFITGGTGFVGGHLIAHFLDRGYTVIATGRKTAFDSISDDRFTYIRADTTQPGEWQEAAAQADVIVNLAGQTIFHRWSRGYKKSIYDSRIKTTRNLAQALDGTRRVDFISASAAGYYGDRGEDSLDETESSGSDFLAGVCRDWESEALAAGKKQARVVLLRFGVVLGKTGGAMAKMIPAFRFGLGGPLGNGRQWFPWIHIEDLAGIVQFVLDQTVIEGPVNCVAPQPLRHRDLAKTLGSVLRRPAFMPAPGFLVRMVLGEFGSAIMSSQKAEPRKLIQNGYSFRYPEICTALNSLV